MSQARRDEVADKLIASMRPVLVLLLVFGVLALVDLFTGSVIDDRLVDSLLLAGCALAAWGFFEMRWVANRIRTNQVPRRLGVGRWVLIIAGSVLTLALAAGMGYATGGPWLAVAFVAAVIALVAIGIVHGWLQRKRMQRAAH